MLKKENAENEDKNLTYEIEYRKLLQWHLERQKKAEEIPYARSNGHDNGSQRAVFEKETGVEYRKKLNCLKIKYNRA